jgi:hypothetical protein
MSFKFGHPFVKTKYRYQKAKSASEVPALT